MAGPGAPGRPATRSPMAMTTPPTVRRTSARTVVRGLPWRAIRAMWSRLASAK
ncbi:MAG: hypothetical protein WKF80_00545 [Thermomicrobiales bacterium]